MGMLFRVYTISYFLFYLYFSFNTKIIPHYSVLDWVEIAVVATALIGMISYAFQMKLLTRAFWGYYRFIFIIFELIYMTWLQQPLLEKLELQAYAASNNVMNIILFIPVIYALIQLERKWDILFPEIKQVS